MDIVKSRFFLLLLYFSFLNAAQLCAHTALLFVEENDDGTVYIETGISTGDSVGGAKIILRDKSTGQPLNSFTVPDSGKINIPMPAVPYTVTLDMGAGHTVTRTGPLQGAQETQRMQVAAKPGVKAVSTGPVAAAIAGLLVIIIGTLLFLRKRKLK